MDIFASVKARVGVREAAERYGVRVDGRGMARCPFHDDRRPSLYVDGGHFHCFACGAHGDCIDFAARLFRLTPLEAARKLAADFGVAQEKPKKHDEAQRLGKDERLCFLRLSEHCRASGDVRPSLRREDRATTLTGALRRPAGSLSTRSICSTS